MCRQYTVFRVLTLHWAFTPSQVIGANISLISVSSDTGDVNIPPRRDWPVGWHQSIAKRDWSTGRRKCISEHVWSRGWCQHGLWLVKIFSPRWDCPDICACQHAYDHSSQKHTPSCLLYNTSNTQFKLTLSSGSLHLSNIHNSVRSWEVVAQQVYGRLQQIFTLGPTRHIMCRVWINSNTRPHKFLLITAQRSVLGHVTTLQVGLNAG